MIYSQKKKINIRLDKAEARDRFTENTAYMHGYYLNLLKKNKIRVRTQLSENKTEP